MAGGNGDNRIRRTTELYIPATGKSCFLQSLPRARSVHTLDRLDDGTIVACGGDGDQNTCVKFEASSPLGTWTNYAKPLVHNRAYHTSFVYQNKILLMGGYPAGSPNTAELVGGGIQFNLTEALK